MTRQTFGTKRYKPEGIWVQATPLLEVAGANHRQEQVKRYFDAVKRADAAGLRYWLYLEPERSNTYHNRAIAVFGRVQKRGWFWNVRTETIMIGYVPLDDAESVSEDLIERGIPIAADLYDLKEAVFEDVTYRDIRFLVLAPKGHSWGARQKSDYKT